MGKNRAEPEVSWIVSTVTNVFSKNKLYRANIFSNRFVNALKGLAEVYKLQRK